MDGAAEATGQPVGLDRKMMNDAEQPAETTTEMVRMADIQPEQLEWSEQPGMARQWPKSNRNGDQIVVGHMRKRKGAMAEDE